jgi:hypothetical protein
VSAAPPGVPAESMVSNSDQWLRKCTLIVSDASGNGLDLSELRIKFEITQADLSTFRPTTAIITIYNLSDQTVANAIKEFTEVTLQAGYQPPGKFGVIFQGTIKAFERGHESVTDSYLTIFAADGDLANFVLMNHTLAPGYSPEDEQKAITDALQEYGLSKGAMSGLSGGTGGISPDAFRGKLMLGTAPDLLDNLGKTHGFTWTIINGKIQSVPLTGYLPGEAVILNAASGLIGWPRNTLGGVNVTCLLNPSLQLQGLIQINNKDINTTSPAQGAGLAGFPNAVVGFPGLNQTSFFATVANDGFYRILVLEYEGDTRGNPWYCHLTCLAADLSATPGQQVPLTNPIASPLDQDFSGGGT